MDKKSINSNKQFMIGNGILAFGVFFIVCLFLYLGFRNQRGGENSKAYEGIYIISLDDSFAGDSLSVYINDSLLLVRSMGKEKVRLQVARFADECALLVVDHRTDEVTPFNLSEEGSAVTVRKSSGKIYFEETIPRK